MDTLIINQVKEKLSQLAAQPSTGTLTYRLGQSLYINGQTNLLSHTGDQFEFAVDDHHGDFYVNISLAGGISAVCTCKSKQMCRHQAAAFMQLHELLKLEQESKPPEGIKYSRKGMMKRVVEERIEKAHHADYKIEFADNIFGEHVLTNEKGVAYHLTFRDLERKHGYCSCPDYRTNKLGTCKHLIFAFESLAKNEITIPEILPGYPFIEVFLNPFRDLKISWYYPEKPMGEVAELLYRYFGNKNYIADEEVEPFLGFLNNAQNFKQILVRPEVLNKVEKAHESAALEVMGKTEKIDFNLLNDKLLPYQEAGVEFATFKTGTILADELGLNKTSQAIAVAIMKKQFFGFRTTLVICPSSLKVTWKNKIENLTGENAMIIEGSTEERNLLYQSGQAFFKIVNYDLLVKDQHIIKQFQPDFVIIDEAQKIKNYTSVISSAIKSIPRKHTLLLAHPSLETDLLELYSLVLFVDPDLLTPLWEFSYQHCYFNPENKNKVVGYYDLEILWKKLEKVLLRRSKSEVIRQLPKILNLDVPVKMDARQARLQVSFATEAVLILQQQLITPFDTRKLSLLFEKLRMAATATNLIEDSTKTALKLEELRNILIEKLHILKGANKVVVFTSWRKMAHLIQRALKVHHINCVEIEPNTPLPKKKELMGIFEKNPAVPVLITTDDDITDIKLQQADAIVFFDIPEKSISENRWPGKIDPLVNRKNSLTIINLISENSIDEIFHLISNVKSDTNKSFTGFSINVADSKWKEFWIEKLSNMADTLQTLPLPFEDAHIKTQPGRQILIDFDEDVYSPLAFRDEELKHPTSDITQNEKAAFDEEIMEKVLKSGLTFISELYKASTGEDITLLGDSLSTNTETGEIILRIKKV